MKRRWFFLLVFIFLYIVPVNLAPYSSHSAIPTEQNLLSDFEVGEVVLTEFGKSVYLGGGSWNYVTQMGTANTWDGEKWVRWIYNQTAKSVTIQNVTLTHLEGGVVQMTTDSGLEIGRLKWYSQYYSGGQWQNVSLPNYQWLGFEVNETHGIANQRFWGATGELVVSYIYRNNEEFKISVNVTNNAAQSVPVRILWVAHDIKNVAGNYELIEQEVFGKNVTVGIDIEGFRLRWLDVYNADPNIAINTILDKENRRAAVVFGNQSSVLPAGYTYTLDPSVNPVLGADEDDDWWRLDETGPTWYHNTASLTVRLREYLNTYWYRGQFRFALAIPQGATIDSANMSLYEYEDSGDQDADIWRISEDNVGSLEADDTAPSCDYSYSDTWDFDGVGSEWNTDSITALVQQQVNLGGWSSGQYIGFMLNITTTGAGTHFQFEDYQDATSNHAYLNITYTEVGGNTIPSNDGCELTNPDDTDNLYAVYKEYIFTSNVSDADGFADIDYIEMSCYSAGAYWTVRYDEDTDTFSEQAGSSYIILGGSSSANEAGNDIDITWYIEISWSHSSLDNYDLRLYVVDDEPESDTDDYDLNYDYISEVDITTGPTLDDGSGTADRGDYDSIDSITATGTIDYYSSSISPASNEVDVWVICSDVAGGPWSDLTLTDGAFSLTVDSDDTVGLDTYSFKVVEEGAGSGDSDLLHSAETDTYIADRMVITILADDDTVINGTQVNFTVSVIYDYDDVSFSWWNISVTNDGVFFGVFNYSSTNFNDTDADTTNVYSVDALNNETTHIITKFSVVTESVTWSAEGVPTTTTTITTDTGFLFQLFLSVEIWSILGPALIVICGFFVAKENKGLGVIFFIVECLVVYQYFMLIDATPYYWWHIIILMFGGIIPSCFLLSDR